MKRNLLLIFLLLISINAFSARKKLVFNEMTGQFEKVEIEDGYYYKQRSEEYLTSITPVTLTFSNGLRVNGQFNNGHAVGRVTWETTNFLLITNRDGSDQNPSLLIFPGNGISYRGKYIKFMSGLMGKMNDDKWTFTGAWSGFDTNKSKLGDFTWGGYNWKEYNNPDGFTDILGGLLAGAGILGIGVMTLAALAVTATVPEMFVLVIF